MSQEYDVSLIPFTYGAAMPRHARVKLTAGVLALAGATDYELGCLVSPTLDTSGTTTVRLVNHPGTQRMIASGAISANSDVFAAADGKIAATGTIYLGQSREAATADGDIIEVLRAFNVHPSEYLGGAVSTVAATGSAQGDAAALTARTINVVTAADGTKGVILPTAIAGLSLTVYNSVATNGLKIYPPTGGDINDGTTNAAITIEGKTRAKFEAVDGTTWISSYTADS